MSKLGIHYADRCRTPGVVGVRHFPFLMIECFMNRQEAFLHATKARRLLREWEKLLPHLSPLSADPFKVEPHVSLVKLVLGSPFCKRPDHVFVKEPAIVVVPRFVFLWHSRNEPHKNENRVRATELSPTWLGLVLFIVPTTSLRENVSTGKNEGQHLL